MKQLWPNKYVNYSSISYKLFDRFTLYIWNKVFKSSYIKNNNFFFRNKSESSLLFIDLSIIKTKKISFLNKVIILYKIYNDKYLIELKSIKEKMFLIFYLRVINNM